MSNYEFIGMLFIIAIPVVSGLIALVKPIIAIMRNIQKITDDVGYIKLSYADLAVMVKKHEEILQEHEKRISIMEHRDE